MGNAPRRLPAPGPAGDAGIGRAGNGGDDARWGGCHLPV